MNALARLASVGLLSVLGLSSCSRSTTPVESTTLGGTVHIVVQNVGTQPFFVDVPPPAPVAVNPPLVKVLPSSSVEYCGCRTPFAHSGLLISNEDLSLHANVVLVLRKVPASLTEEWTSNVRVSVDASGNVLATSDVPDVVGISSVTRL